jgi:hypothetical protein
MNVHGVKTRLTSIRIEYAELLELTIESVTGVKGVQVAATRLFVRDEATVVETSDNYRVGSGPNSILADRCAGDEVLRLKRGKRTGQDVPSRTITYGLPTEPIQQ